MTPRMTAEDIAVRVRIMTRAFTWDKPLPQGYVERLQRFDSGEDRSEEMWGPDYRLTKDELDEPAIKRRLRLYPK